MTQEFKIGSHCLGKAHKHFNERFKDVKPGALRGAMIEIAMDGFRIGYSGKTELYEALKAMTDDDPSNCYYCKHCDRHAPNAQDGRIIGTVSHEAGCAYGMAISALTKVRGETE